MYLLYYRSSYERKIEKKTGGKTTVKQLAYALGKHQVTVEKVDNELEKTYYHHNDLIGTTRFIRDSNWVMVAENIVSPYGKPLVSKEVTEGSKQGHMKWAGHDSINENTGLTYMQARWMDNNTGRFISMDPVKDGYNWYSYCAGNPVSYVDPNGLETYTVQSGDRLWKITKAFYGDRLSYQNVADYNNITNPDFIYPGQVINLPEISDLGSSSSSSDNSFSGTWSGIIDAFKSAFFNSTGKGSTSKNSTSKNSTTKGSTDSMPERKPDPEVARQKLREAWEKLIAACRPVADKWLRSQPYRGERDSQKSMNSGNSDDSVFKRRGNTFKERFQNWKSEYKDSATKGEASTIFKERGSTFKERFQDWQNDRKEWRRDGFIFNPDGTRTFATASCKESIYKIFRYSRARRKVVFHMNIKDEYLKLILEDPNFQKKKDEVIEKIKQGRTEGTESFALGGDKPGGLNRLNPKTNAVMTNKLFWLNRNTNMDYTGKVDENGLVSITFDFHDYFDLQESEDKSRAYNLFARTVGNFAHKGLGFSTDTAVIGNFTATYDKEGNLVNYKNNLDTEF